MVGFFSSAERGRVRGGIVIHAGAGSTVIVEAQPAQEPQPPAEKKRRVEENRKCLSYLEKYIPGDFNFRSHRAPVLIWRGLGWFRPVLSPRLILSAEKDSDISSLRLRQLARSTGPAWSSPSWQCSGTERSLRRQSGAWGRKYAARGQSPQDCGAECERLVRRL